MNFQLSATLTWWDVSEIMTLREVEEYCVSNDVVPKVSNGRVYLPIYVLEEVTA